MLETTLPGRIVLFVKLLVYSIALLTSIVSIGQESIPTRNCTTHGFFLHKTPCLCGEVHVTSGDISLAPEVFGLDDGLDVELRDKKRKLLESKHISYKAGRTFCFSGRTKGVYALAFISYKEGEPQPAAVHPIKYTAKGCDERRPVIYSVPPDCPKWMLIGMLGDVTKNRYFTHNGFWVRLPVDDSYTDCLNVLAV